MKRTYPVNWHGQEPKEYDFKVGDLVKRKKSPEIGVVVECRDDNLFPVKVNWFSKSRMDWEYISGLYIYEGGVETMEKEICTRNKEETIQHYKSFAENNPECFVDETWKDLQQFARGEDWNGVIPEYAPDIGEDAWCEVVEALMNTYHQATEAKWRRRKYRDGKSIP